MSMLDNLREARSVAAASVDELLAATEVTAEGIEAAEARSAEIADLDSKISTLEAAEARAAAVAESRAAAGVKPFAQAKVGKEALTYEERGKASFVRDMIGASLRNEPQAWERLNRHRAEMDVELRDINRTDGSGGEFVPPLWLLSDYAEFARAARVTANLTTNLALPAGTDSINVPAITTGTQTGFQASDNGSTTTRDMVTATVSAPVRTISGYENVSIQLVEQSPLQGGLDKLIFGDLMADYAMQLNTAVLGNGDGTSGTLRGLLNVGADTTNGIPVTWTETTPTATNGLKAIAQAISKIATNRYKPTEAIVMSPSTWYWLMAQVDSSSRPLVVPVAAGPFNANGVVADPGQSAGLVGTIHGVPVYIDATMTKTYGAATNQAPILVGKFSDSYLFESGVKTRVLPDVLSANLTVRFQVYGYAALANRFAKSVSAITGTGTVAPTGF